MSADSSRRSLADLVEQKASLVSELNQCEQLLASLDDHA